eukprot:SAG22_NODE_2253_length_2783_cov_1.337928_4_plen_184_part_00
MASQFPHAKTLQRAAANTIRVDCSRQTTGAHLGAQPKLRHAEQPGHETGLVPGSEVDSHWICQQGSANVISACTLAVLEYTRRSRRVAQVGLGTHHRSSQLSSRAARPLLVQAQPATMQTRAPAHLSAAAGAIAERPCCRIALPAMARGHQLARQHRTAAALTAASRPPPPPSPPLLAAAGCS